MTVARLPRNPIIVTGQLIRFRVVNTEASAFLLLPVDEIIAASEAALGSQEAFVFTRDGDQHRVEHYFADVEAAMALASARSIDPDASMPKAEKIGH